MLFSKSSSYQAETQSHKSLLSTEKLRHVTGKILRKLKLSKRDDTTDLDELASSEVQVATFVTCIRPTDAPRIIDLKAMRQSIRPQLPRINTHVPCSQAALQTSELRLQAFFENKRSAAATGTPLRRNPQQAYIFEATSDRSSAAALDDVVDYEGYELLDKDDDDEDRCLDWTLLDLPEKIYGRLANESRHSLI